MAAATAVLAALIAVTAVAAGPMISAGRAGTCCWLRAGLVAGHRAVARVVLQRAAGGHGGRPA